MITICFTGHRPDKLGGYDWNTPKNKRIMEKLKSSLIELINSTHENHFRFICGGALGIDQMAFEICDYLKNSTFKLNPIIIETILAMPFEKQACKWFKQSDVDRFNSQRSRADEVVLVDTIEGYKLCEIDIGEYHPAKMDLRNRYMVDNSDKVFAVWNGTKGGTGNCVNYAKKKGKEIIGFNPDKI